MSEELTDVVSGEMVAHLQKLARGQTGHAFRQELRERYVNAYRSANNTDNLPFVQYLNGWWVITQGGYFHNKYRTANFIRMIFRLEARIRK